MPKRQWQHRAAQVTAAGGVEIRGSAVTSGSRKCICQGDLSVCCQDRRMKYRVNCTGYIVSFKCLPRPVGARALNERRTWNVWGFEDAFAAER